MENSGGAIRVVTIAGAAALCAAAVWALVAVLGDSDPSNAISKVSTAALILILFSPIGLAGVALAARRPGIAWFGYVTTLIAFATFAIVTRQLWHASNILYGGDDWKLPGVAIFVAVACGQVSLLLAWARSGALMQALGAWASTAVVVLATLGVLEILAEIDISDRIYGVLAVLYLLPVALLPLLTLGRRADSTRPPKTEGSATS
ncbi:MAG TPA: hypothetical protein VFJ57_14690 [Solirubrobacterales bacterium]|nr:hypothetical protein [Solirubrobacterales bacterium]